MLSIRKTALFTRFLMVVGMVPLMAQAPQYETYLPHFSQKADQWQTRIGLYNPASTTAQIIIEAFGEDGSLLSQKNRFLPPRGDWNGSILDLIGPLALETGWIRLTSDHPQLSGTVTFRSLSGGGRTSLPLTEATTKGLLFPLLETQAHRQSGIALINPSDVACTVTLRASGFNRQHIQTQTLTLAPGTKLVKMVAELYPKPLPSTFSLEVTADQPVTGFGLTFQEGLQQIVAVPATPWEPGLLPKLRQIVSDWHERANVRSGISMAVNHPEWGTLVAAAGKADLEQNRSMLPDTITEIGSISKVFIATLFLKLQENALLDLDDSLDQFLPNFPQGQDISLRLLLNHQSGLPNYTDLVSLNQALSASLLGNGPTWSPQQILQEALAHPFLFEPGTQFRYSNTNYLVLAMVAEQIEQKSLGEQLREQFWEPLGMRGTFMAHSETTPERAATYLFDGSENKLLNISHMDMNWLWGTSIVSTPEDLIIWSKALFEGKVITAESLNQMLTPGTTNLENPTYGLGMGIFQVGDRLSYIHSGQTLGATAQMLYFPQTGVAMSFVVNNNHLDDAYITMFQEISQLFSAQKKPLEELLSRDVSFIPHPN